MFIQLTATPNKDTIDGYTYKTYRAGINYTILRTSENIVDVWKDNRMRGSLSTVRYWDGVDNQGKKMPKFLTQIIKLIEESKEV